MRVIYTDMAVVAICYTYVVVAIYVATRTAMMILR